MNEILDTIVIGGGWAGIAAARDLNDRGRSTAILEGSDHVGGRTFGRTFPGLGEDVHADFGGAWINREIQPLMRREVARYGVALKEDKPTENAVFRTGGVTRSLPVPVEQLGDLERAMSHLAQTSRRVAPSRPVTIQNLRDLDISADEFFAPLDLPTETREFIYAILSMYTGAHLSRCSMLNVIVQTAAFGHSCYGFVSAIKERFVRGPESLLHEMIEHDRLDLRLNHKVVRIEQTEASVSVWTDGGVRVDARTCIVAVPTNVMRHIEFGPQLSADKQSALATNHVGRAYKPIILARNLPRHPFAIGNGALQTILTSTELADDTYLLVGFGAEDIEAIDPADAAQIQKAVQDYFPGAEVLDVQAHNWNEDPLFDGTWRWDAPGQAIDFIEVMNNAEGRIVFAGTDLDNSVWRTWMEGALNSSQEAVDVVWSLLRRDGLV